MALRDLSWRHTALLGVLLLGLGGCSSLFGASEEDKADQEATKPLGERISVMQREKRSGSEVGATDIKPQLASSVANKNWSQAGGNAEHAIPHPALGATLEESWSSSIGRGSSGEYKLLASPVVQDGRVFTMDARGFVRAFDAADGDEIWDVDTSPEESNGYAIGGGVAATEGLVFASTGFGEVLAIKAADGEVLWRKMIGKPLRSAPTYGGGMVFVVSIDNELSALSAKNGTLLWHHNGIAESAALMGASSPAMQGDNVVVAYSSGEIFALRAANGRVSWTDVLAVPAQVGALPAIADIRGLPVIDKGHVFAVSHSGRMAAISLRTGERLWETDIGGVNTPVLSGNTLFLMANDNRLMALTREGGKVIWSKELQKLEEPDDKDSDPVSWWGPLLAGSRLWLTNSLGEVVSFDAADGQETARYDLGGAFFMPPIAAGGVLYALNDKGRLIALR